MDQASAKSACRSIPGADLTSVHNFDELIQVKQIWQSKDADGHAWIGLECGSESTVCKRADFEWTDGSAVDYTKWPGNQLTFSEENRCAILAEFDYGTGFYGYTKQFGFYINPCDDLHGRRTAICKLKRRV